MIYYIDVAVRIITVNIIICLARSDDGGVIVDASERFDCSLGIVYLFSYYLWLSNYNMYFTHFTIILK